MQLTIHVNSHYDWQPVPSGVEPTEEDKKARRVKPSSNGMWLMRVPKKVDTHTTINMPESMIIATIISDMCRDHVILTRRQAVARHLARDVMPHHAHASWMKRVDVYDDGPNEAEFRNVLDLHVAAGNIETEDVEDMLKAYLEPADSEAHVTHLHKHFRIKEKTK